MKRPGRRRGSIESAIGVACMAALVAITLGNVATRHLTDGSFAWTEEISVFLLVVLTLAGAASVAARDAHVRIEFLYDGGTPERRRRLRRLAALATSAVFLVLAVLFAVTVADEMRWNETSMGLGVPRWWFTVVVPPLCLAVAWRAWQARRAPVEPPPP